MTIQFTDFALQSDLIATIQEMGFITPTPIQETAIPLLLQGKDIIGQAQTGTGKTAAFGFPLLNNLNPKDRYVQALVMLPTRELAIQVADALQEYGAGVGAKVLTVYGGSSYQQQIAGLRKGCNIVVGTPGRLIDLIKQDILRLDRIHTLVLDEADEMLSMGFADDLEYVMSRVPEERQTMLFSATLPRQITSLTKKYMHEAESVSIAAKQLTGTTISESYYMVHPKDKIAAISRILEMEEAENILIFARTRLATGEIANALSSRGLAAEALNGDLSQDAREQVLNRFRHGQVKVLVATDVAARGLDIQDITHVFNHDLPEEAEVYVHRVGRTGRAGREGKAISLITPRERWRLNKIEKYTRQTITQAQLPTPEEIEERRQNRFMEQLTVWIRRGRCRNERDMVERLMEEGLDPMDIAAAALKIGRAGEKKRPIERLTPIREERRGRGRNEKRPWDKRERGERNRRGKWDKRSDRKSVPGNRDRDRDMVSLTLDTGRANGVAVNHVVASLTHYSGIAGSNLGKIRVEQQHTLVDVPSTLADQVLALDGNCKINRRKVSVKRS